MTDIVEKLTIWPAADGADALAGHFVEALMQEAIAEITKLRAERDAAARDMRERCKAVAMERLTSLEKLRDDLHTPEAKGNVQDSMDQVLIVLGAIAALPDAVIATDREGGAT